MTENNDIIRRLRGMATARHDDLSVAAAAAPAKEGGG
jgi:hypothetical protein